MKIKYLLIGLMISSGTLFTSCGGGEESETKEEETTEHDEVVEEEVEEEDLDLLDEEYDAYSVQGQWDDIVFQIGTGDLANLDMYVDYYAENFSEEEWNAIDLSYPQYEEAFASYESFEDIPEAEYFAPGARVVQVYFETESDGMTFESMVMIYLENRNGLIWIIGTEMAG